jgi:3-phytase
VFGGDVIRHEPEGIALYTCGTHDGYWIVTDQHHRQNRFLVFQRASFELAGAFTGSIVTNTDGIAVVQAPVGAMAAGALYAVHNDRAIGTFSWSAVADALDLRDDCVSEGSAGP